MLIDAIACLGECGLTVPALTISPSSNFVFWQFWLRFQSRTFWLTEGFSRLRGDARVLGTSKVTNHVCFTCQRPNETEIAAAAANVLWFLVELKHPHLRRSSLRSVRPVRRS
jgi:hypothetical protein